jgi:hypothetical protein
VQKLFIVHKIQLSSFVEPIIPPEKMQISTYVKKQLDTSVTATIARCNSTPSTWIWPVPQATTQLHPINADVTTAMSHNTMVWCTTSTQLYLDQRGYGWLRVTTQGAIMLLLVVFPLLLSFLPRKQSCDISYIHVDHDGFISWDGECHKTANVSSRICSVANALFAKLYAH